MLTVNEYFEGKVKSIAMETEGQAATVGVMEAGEYEFGTSQKEEMTVVAGTMVVKLPGADDWITVQKGESFRIDANAKFQVKLSGQTAYYCTYE